MTRNIIISLVVAVIAKLLTDLEELSDSTDYYFRFITMLIIHRWKVPKYIYQRNLRI